jgi:signal transduction histidine kinase
MGAELGRLEQEMGKYSGVMRRLQQDHALNLNEIYRQLVLNLLDRAGNPCRLVGESYDEEMALPLRLQANDVNTVCFIFSSKLVLCYLFHEYHQAIEHAAVAEKYLDSLVGTAAIPGFHLYDSLARLAVFADAGESEQKDILEKVVANQAKMQLWARHAPMNHAHKFYLVEAERARVAGNDRDAREHYDQAIDLAQEHGYVNEEALANEVAARFYLARGQTRIAQHYLHDAYYAYLRWGATAKVKDLEARYPKFLAQPVTDFSRSVVSTVTTNTEQRLSSTFDFTSVLKASQAIASEIILDRLLTTLMKIVIENAGAQRGVLLLKKEGRLFIEAEGEVDKDDITVLQAVPVEATPDLPTAVVHYVEHTKEPVVLSDATQETVFTTDPYIAKRRPKSVLCMPLIKQGKLTGIVYLENNLTTDAFTPERLEVLNLLSAEAAASLENAQLYRSLEETKERLADYSKALEEKVTERTQALQEKNQELEIVTQQAIEATQRKSQFLAGMSHELRTPMNAILGFTRLVLRRAGDLLPERQRDNLVKVRESADHLLNLINQLLDLSRLEAGRMEVRPAPFDVRQFILACCEMVSPLVKPGVQLKEEIPHEVGAADTDEDGLRHILLNLLGNAIKFTDVGEVVVHARIRGQANGRATLIVSVADTGVGIPANAIATVFEEFQQVEGGVQKREGTGLGLPIARRWAELLGGSIAVESEHGKGSMFTVTVPVVYQQPTEKSVESVVG